MASLAIVLMLSTIIQVLVGESQSGKKAKSNTAYQILYQYFEHFLQT